MARPYRVTVKYDPTDATLKIESEDQRNLILAANNPLIYSLVWDFEGIDGLVSAGWAPAIRFRLAPEKAISRYSGPFTHLTRTTTSVIACGNTGHEGKYAYRAVLEPPIESSLRDIRTAEAHLFNQVPQRAEALVRVWFPADCEGLLQLEPEAVKYIAGQSILWEVIGAPEDLKEWYPRLVFADGPGSMNSHFGPFASLDTRDQGILASGSIGQPGRYDYLFQMVNVEDGKVQFESSSDPTVDDEGNPAGGSGSTGSPGTGG